MSEAIIKRSGKICLRFTSHQPAATIVCCRSGLDYARLHGRAHACSHAAGPSVSALDGRKVGVRVYWEAELSEASPSNASQKLPGGLPPAARLPVSRASCSLSSRKHSLVAREIGNTLGCAPVAYTLVVCYEDAFRSVVRRESRWPFPTTPPCEKSVLLASVIDGTC